MQKDAKKELAALRSMTGGFALAEKLLTPWLRQSMNIYAASTSSSWSWYTKQVEEVKTGKDCLSYNVRMMNGGWASIGGQRHETAANFPLARVTGRGFLCVRKSSSNDWLVVST